MRLLRYMLVLVLSFPLLSAGQPVGDGVHDDTAAIQVELDSGQALLPCGTYRLTQPLRMPSGSTLSGQGMCSVLRADAAFLRQYPPSPYAPHTMLLTNSDYVQGNANLTVRDVAFDASQADWGFLHAVHFHNTHDVAVIGVHTLRGGDGVAFTQSQQFVVTNSVFVAPWIAGVDMWDSVVDGRIVGNTIQGQGRSNAGVTVTAAPSQRVMIQGSTIQGVPGIGIYFQGGCQGGIVNSAAINNTILGPVAQGIRLAEGQTIRVQQNTILNAQVGIMGAGDCAAAGTANMVQQNLIDGATTSIWLQYGAFNWLLTGNMAPNQAPLQLDAGTSGNLIGADNAMPILDSSLWNKRLE